MNFTSTGVQLARGWQTIWNGGPAAQIVLLLCCVGFTIALCFLALLALMFFRALSARREPTEFEVYGTGDNDHIGMAIVTSSGPTSLIKKLDSEEQIALVPSKFFRARAAGLLRRKQDPYPPTKIEVGPINFKKLTGQVWANNPQKVKLWIRPGGSVFRYPNEAVRVSTVVALLLTLLNLAVSVVIGALFWRFPYH